MKNQEPVRVRAHHGMCLAFFRGKGYSEDFTGHMGRVKMWLLDNPQILLADTADEICSRCPNLRDGSCESAEQVAGYDRRVLELCGLRAGGKLAFAEFAGLVQERILSAGKRETVCGDCQWSSLCTNTGAAGSSGDDPP